MLNKWLDGGNDLCSRRSDANDRHAFPLEKLKRIVLRPASGVDEPALEVVQALDVGPFPGIEHARAVQEPVASSSKSAVGSSFGRMMRYHLLRSSSHSARSYHRSALSSAL